MSVRVSSAAVQWTFRVLAVTCGPGITPLCAANPSRLTLHFSTPQGKLGGLNIGPIANPAVDMGIPLDLPPLQYDFFKNPGIVGQAWFAWSAGANTVTVIEEIPVPSQE